MCNRFSSDTFVTVYSFTFSLVILLYLLKKFWFVFFFSDLIVTLSRNFCEINHLQLGKILLLRKIKYIYKVTGEAASSWERRKIFFVKSQGKYNENKN